MNHVSKPLVVASYLALITFPFLTTGCQPATTRAALAVSSEQTQLGQPIYVGSVYPLAGSAKAPTFIYERRVAERGAALVSTHVTRDLNGQIAVAEAATHSADYALSRYDLYTNQTGQRGSVTLQRGDVHFELIDGTETRTAVERQPKSPVVVGPTLVGHILIHLSELRGGKTLSVRLAVLDRLETLGFELSNVPAAAGQTRIRMKPSSLLVRLAVDPEYFTFETATGKLLRLEGRVPPKLPTPEGLADLDARVDYRFVAAHYR